MMPEKIDSKDVRLDVVDFIVAGKCLDESKGCSGTNKYDVCKFSLPSRAPMRNLNYYGFPL